MREPDWQWPVDWRGLALLGVVIGLVVVLLNAFL
jgi:hypothetical protein